MRLFLHGLILAVIAIAITACSNSKNTITGIEGTAYYLQRIALPQNARLEVSLNDVTSKNGTAVVLDTQQFPTDGKQVPLAFTYKVPKNIDPDKRYSLSAAIKGEQGETIFVTNREYLVLTDADKTSVVKLQLVSG